MSRVDFFASNPEHHLTMLLPVAAQLTEDGYRCRVLSLCELRGFDTPRDRIHAAGAEALALFPAGVRRSSSSGSQENGAAPTTRRRWSRALAWQLVVRRRLRAAWRSQPTVAVLPNDAAYPYERVAASCRQREVPFVLVQEGIRFPLPSEGTDGYGTGGADLLATWGTGSSEFFRSRGVAADRILVTGNPRFEGSMPRGSTAPVGRPRLLLATNPIDDQGFCSTEAKYELVDRFLDAAEPLVASREMSLALRWHPRESAEAYERLLDGRSWGTEVERANADTLDRVLTASSAVAILASTVGLEAIAAGKPLGVLEIPGWGHVFDYVKEGVARPISLESDPSAQLRSLIVSQPHGTREALFLERHLGPRSGAATSIAEAIKRLASSP